MVFLKNVKSFISLWMLIGWASFLILVGHNHGSNGAVLKQPQLFLVAPKQASSRRLNVDRSDDLSLAHDVIDDGTFIITKTLGSEWPLFEDNSIIQNENENENRHPYGNSNSDGYLNSNENVMEAQLSAIASSDPDSASESVSVTNQREEDEYPSFQDYLERIADVGYGYVIRDLLTGYLSDDAQTRLIIGGLGRVGVVAYATQLIAQAGNSTGLISEDESRKLLRVARYTGVGIALIGSFYDLYVLIDSTRCLVRQKRVRKTCLLEDDSDSEFDSHLSYNNSIIHNMDMDIIISKQLKRIDLESELKREKMKKKAKDNHFKWKNIFSHGNDGDTRFCEEMRKRVEYAVAEGRSPSVCQRDNPLIEIFGSLLATASDAVGFVHPQYGQPGGLTEALYQILAYLYLQGQERDLFNNVDGHSVFHLGELGELIYRELKGIFEDSGPPFPGLPDWMFKELFKHHGTKD